VLIKATHRALATAAQCPLDPGAAYPQRSGQPSTPGRYSPEEEVRLDAVLLRIERCGVFVTILRDCRLRGCLGYVDAFRPLHGASFSPRGLSFVRPWRGATSRGPHGENGAQARAATALLSPNNAFITLFLFLFTHFSFTTGIRCTKASLNMASMNP
jgi:hypothetical protein